MFSIREAGHITRSAHLLSNPVIDVAGDAATGTWRFAMHYIDAGSGRLHHIVGRYKDRFVRVGGQWLFQALTAHVEFRGVSDGQVDQAFYAPGMVPSWEAVAILSPSNRMLISGTNSMITRNGVFR